ncbi:MAG: hypothetical protein Q7T86_10765 [Hyphomicrobiaceae bacterium]|nr:hypothetical protein [Hyphomicrobiaceae bacterium]
MAKLHRLGISQETQLRQVAVIQGLMADLERTVQILSIDIATEEERVRVFDPSAPAYPILARTLRARRDNLCDTIAALGQRRRMIAETIEISVAEAA